MPCNPIPYSNKDGTTYVVISEIRIRLSGHVRRTSATGPVISYKISTGGVSGIGGFECDTVFTNSISYNRVFGINNGVTIDAGLGASMKVYQVSTQPQRCIMTGRGFLVRKYFCTGNGTCYTTSDAPAYFLCIWGV